MIVTPMPESRLQKRLRLKEFKLNTLLEITNSVNNNVGTPELFKLFRHILRNQLNIGKCILYSRSEEGWDCVINYGTRGKEKKFDVDNDLSHIKAITVVESSSKKHLDTFDVVIPVYHKNMPLAYLLLGDIDETEVRISSIIKHLNFIQTLANIVAVAIENKRLAKESLRQERIKKELEFASEMQELLFPGELPDNDQVQIAAHYQPHQQVGGDYYDFIALNKDEFVFCLADVSGKGVSAAMLMANFQANVRAFIHYSRFSLTNLINELNSRVMAAAKGEKFITLFIGKYNVQTRVLNYVNAAHNPPVVRINNTILHLDKGCTGLGMFDEIPVVEEGLVNIPPDAVMVAYTDGVVEQENAAGESLDLEFLEQIVTKHPRMGMTKLNKKVLSELDEFRGDTAYVDDIALFSIRFH